MFYALLRKVRPVEHIVDAENVLWTLDQINTRDHLHAEPAIRQPFKPGQQIRTAQEPRHQIVDIPIAPQQGKVVAGNTPERLSRARAFRDELGPVAEQLVADVVSVDIIDELEVADIAVPERIFAVAASGQQFRRVRLELGEIAVSRNRIVLRLIAQMAQCPHVIIHVRDRTHNTQELALRIALERRRDAAPDERTVTAAQAHRRLHLILTVQRSVKRLEIGHVTRVHRQ